MARIPQNEVDRLKREVSVERLAQARGIELKRHGKELLGRCPFHDDRTPSLAIDPAKNLWHCLGACQTGGGPIDWVMKAEGVSFRYAVELMRNDGYSLAADIKPTKAKTRCTVQKLDSFTKPDTPDDVVLQRVVDYYHDALKQSPEAQQYLRDRGLVHREMVEHFKLGFANRTLAYRLPQKNRQAGAAIRSQLQRLGVLRTSGHEHLNGSLVIPVFDAQGRVVEMYGRKITKGLRKGTPLHMYLPGPHRGVFNREALTASKEIILCESLIDALTFWCAGHRNVTAAYGIEGLTDDHWQAFREHGTESILIAYDRDDAGNKAASQLAKALSDAGIGSYRIEFPRGMDANDYARKVTPADKSLGLALRNAVWTGKGKPMEKGGARVETIEAVPESQVKATDGHEAKAAENEVESNPMDDSTEVAVDDTLQVNPGPTVPSAAESTSATTPPTAEITSLAAPTPVADPQPSQPVGLPTAPANPIEADVRDDEVILRFGDRRWRVRGLAKNTSYEKLLVNLLVAREIDGQDEAFHVDTLELYSSRQRVVFLKQACMELGLEERVLKKDLGKVLRKLEELQDAQIQEALKPEKERVELSDTEKAEALELLRDPKLLDRVVADYERCGVVGERSNKLVGYLAAVSRKLDDPLGVVIQSSSAAGKSSLMDAVLAFMPDEERVQYSAMTGQALYYMGESDLKHKILALAEEEGAHSASYALKLLQSESQLTIASTGKDSTTGRLETQEYRVEGPVMIFMTTTAIEVDEELLNRCVVLTVDEGRDQTKAIHDQQRHKQTLEGLLAKTDRERVLEHHQNAQRLLRPLHVVNPYAKDLTFSDHQTRTRRDHMKYLTLIRSITLLHQYQREVKTVQHRGQALRYIEVSREDVVLANELADEVLGRVLDELPPQTRRLLLEIDAMVDAKANKQGLDRCDVRFTQREIREYGGWGNTQLKMHMHRLLELEYVLAHRGGRGQRFVYELLYEGRGKNGEQFLSGLIDAGVLSEHGYDANRSGSEPNKSGQETNQSPPSRPQVGGMSGGGRGAHNGTEVGTSARVYTIGHFEAEKRT